MSKTFTYTKITQKVYLANTDEYEEFGDDFDYTVDDEDLLDAIVDFVFSDYFKDTELVDYSDYERTVKNGLKEFINDNDILDQLVENYEDELYDYFRDEAFEDE